MTGRGDLSKKMSEKPDFFFVYRSKTRLRRVQESMRREAPYAAPWAVRDEPGLYGYLRGVIYTLVGLYAGGMCYLVQWSDLAQSQSRGSPKEKPRLLRPILALI